MISFTILLLIFSGSYWYVYAGNTIKTLTLYGNVEVRTVNVGFRVGGEIISLNVDEGDKVEAGDILGMLDPETFQIAMNQANGAKKRANSLYQLKKNGYQNHEIVQAKADVEQHRAAYQYAASLYNRQKNLWAKNLISANEFDNADSIKNQKMAALKASESQLQKLTSGYQPEEIEATKGELEQAESALNQAELDFIDTVLKAPSSGIIQTRVVEPGTIISSGSTVFTITLSDPVWVRAFIEEPDLGMAVPGKEVLLYTDSKPNTPYRGRIGFVASTSEFTPKTVQSQNTRTHLVYRLRIVVIDADSQLLQGMPVTVVFNQ